MQGETKRQIIMWIGVAAWAVDLYKQSISLFCFYYLHITLSVLKFCMSMHPSIIYSFIISIDFSCTFWWFFESGSMGAWEEVGAWETFSITAMSTCWFCMFVCPFPNICVPSQASLSLYKRWHDDCLYASATHQSIYIIKTNPTKLIILNLLAPRHPLIPFN
jgi:uncharacterized membrane protein